MSGTSGDDHRVVQAFEHPGAGRKRAKSTPKGRQIDPQALTEMEALLDGRSMQRDLLIEHLHLIQDTYHQISAGHLAALADLMRLSFAEVFETATFYAHFDVVKEGDVSIPPLTIRVCESITCAMLGAEKLFHELSATAGATGPRCARALRRSLRYRACRGGRSSFRRPRRRGQGQRGGEGGRHPPPPSRIRGLRRLSRGGRLPTPGQAALGRYQRRRHHRGARRRRVARPGRRRLSHRPQVARRARREGPAADGHQRRRR